MLYCMRERCLPRKSAVYQQVFVFQNMKTVLWKRILAVNQPELGYILLGCLAALALGGQTPVFAVLVSNLLGVGSYLFLYS